jgi:hypothetical protein
MQRDLRHQRRPHDLGVAADEQVGVQRGAPVSEIVIPAKAGVQGQPSQLVALDTGLRGYDEANTRNLPHDLKRNARR